MGGVRYSRQVTRVLDQHVLKSASSGDERNVAFTGFSNDGVSRFRITVRATGPNHDGRSSYRNLRGVSNRVGWDHTDVDRRAPLGGGMLQS